MPNERVGLDKDSQVFFFFFLIIWWRPRALSLGQCRKQLHTLSWDLCVLPPTLNTHGLDGLQSSFMLLSSLILWFCKQRHALFSIFNHLISSKETRIKMVLPFLALYSFFSLWITLAIYLGQRLSLSGHLFQWLECSWMPYNA